MSEETQHKCPECDGKSINDLMCEECQGMGSDFEDEECAECNGDGYFFGEMQCNDCLYEADESEFEEASQ